MLKFSTQKNSETHNENFIWKIGKLSIFLRKGRVCVCVYSLYEKISDIAGPLRLSFIFLIVPVLFYNKY